MTIRRNIFRWQEARARTSNVTSSNGLSSSVIAPSRERLRPARFTGRPARSTRRARLAGGEGKARGLDVRRRAEHAHFVSSRRGGSGRAVEKIIRGLLHASNKTSPESRCVAPRRKKRAAATCTLRSAEANRRRDSCREKLRARIRSDARPVPARQASPARVPHHRGGSRGRSATAIQRIAAESAESSCRRTPGRASTSRIPRLTNAAENDPRPRRP